MSMEDQAEVLGKKYSAEKVIQATELVRKMAEVCKDSNQTLSFSFWNPPSPRRSTWQAQPSVDCSRRR